MIAARQAGATCAGVEPARRASSSRCSSTVVTTSSGRVRFHARWRSALCAASGDAEGVTYAVIHRDIIRDFGRFPHRNTVLGRETTPEEQAFLDAGGFSG